MFKVKEFPNKKNICLIVGVINKGGMDRAMLTLAHALSKLNHRVEIITLSNTVYSFDKFNIHTIDNPLPPIKGTAPFSRYMRSRKDIKPLRNKIADIGINFDLIVSNLIWTDITCKKLNLPNTYYCIHGALSASMTFQSNKKIALFRFIRSLLIKKLYKGQNLITVSKGAEQDLLKFGIQPKTIQTIYNPFNFQNIKQQSEDFQMDAQDYIVHIGHFDGSQKRHDVLIKAYKESNVKQKLLLLGDNNNKAGEQIKQLVFDLGLQNMVIFKGFHPNPYPYIKNARAMILSSDFEGLPTVLIESLILGTPIVSTNCPSGPSEILIDELESFLSPVGDIKALAENIKKMVENPVKITDKYIDKFKMEKSARQYLALCN